MVMKMNKKLFELEVIGFIFVSVLGTLFHFVYEWSGEKLIVGLFTPVNESSFEHLKLLFFPYIIWGIVEYFILGKKRNILFSKLTGSIIGMTAILTIFYTYTGIIGKNIDIINILSFFIGVLTAFVCDYVILKSGKPDSKVINIISIVFIILIGVMFAVFTVAPPLIPLFRDPQTLTFGI